MTKRLGLLTICILLFANPNLWAACEGSWCSIPSIPPYPNSYCSPGAHQRCSPCTHRNSSPCDFGCSSRSGINLGVDLLYWTVCQANLDYAVDRTTEEGSPDLLGNGDTHFLEYDWNPGVRSYFDIELCGFGIAGRYTWIKNRAEGNKDFTDLDAVLIASLIHPDTELSDALIVSGRQDLWFQAADLLFSKEVEFCDCKLILRPFLGPRWIKIKQELKVAYEGEDFSLAPEQVAWTSTLSGTGLHVGFDLFYRWVCGFGMYGQFAGTVAAAEAKNTHIQGALDSEGNAAPPPNVQLKETQCLCIPGCQLQAGITWDTCCCDTLYIRFRFCYEFNQWWNTPELRRYHYQNEGVSDAAANGTIALHGGTFGLDIRF